jgi:hypothetical protein
MFPGGGSLPHWSTADDEFVDACVNKGEDQMVHHSIRLVVAGFALVATAATSATPAAGSTPPRPIRPRIVSPADLGIDPSTATAPWRATRSTDGSVELVWGNLDATPVDAAAVEIAESGAPSSVSSRGASASAQSWSCAVHYAYSTVREGSNLRTAYDVQCRNVARQRVDWRFQRSSWSGYRDYTHKVTRGWVSGSQDNSQTIRARCGSGGTYDYRGAVVSVAQPKIGDTRVSPTYFTNKGRYACGTGVS